MIKVVATDETMQPPLENCCFCRKPTAYWYRPKDVACCRTCAALAKDEHVPNKEQWVAEHDQPARRRGGDGTLTRIGCVRRRIALGWSRADLAKVALMACSTLGSFESGRSPLSRGWVAMIEAALRKGEAQAADSA